MILPHTTHIFTSPKSVLVQEWYVQDNPEQTVTKYQFSTLFAKACYKAIKPKTLVSGFRKAGVCPFNPKEAVLPEVPPSSESEVPGFTLFNIRFENCYNVYIDKRYVLWLQQIIPRLCHVISDFPRRTKIIAQKQGR